MMLERSFSRHQKIVVAVEDQDRGLDRGEDAAQWTLIGVVEVSRVGKVEREVRQRAEVRDRSMQEPERDELGPVHDVVERLVAEQLHLLHADRRQQHDRGDALGRLTVELERNATAHGEAEQLRALDSELVEPLLDIAGVRGDRVVGDPAARRAEAGQVGRVERPTALRQRRRQSVEVTM